MRLWTESLESPQQQKRSVLKRFKWPELRRKSSKTGLKLVAANRGAADDEVNTKVT